MTCAALNGLREDFQAYPPSWCWCRGTPRPPSLPVWRPSTSRSPSGMWKRVFAPTTSSTFPGGGQPSSDLPDRQSAFRPDAQGRDESEGFGCRGSSQCHGEYGHRRTASDGGIGPRRLFRRPRLAEPARDPRHGSPTGKLGDRLGDIASGMRQLLDRHPDTALLLPLHRNPTVREPLREMLETTPAWC